MLSTDKMHRFPWKWSLMDLQKVNRRPVKVFSCFSCAGGSSMGYKLAGFDVIGNCELDPKVNTVYQENLHPKYSFTEDIRDFVKRTDLPDELYNLDILDGSPPCSTFSFSGSREKAWGKQKKFAEGQKLQRLDDLFFDFIDLAEKLKPKVVVAENVKGLLLGNAKYYVTEILYRFHEIGYDCQLFLLNAAYAGVPQSRERVFFVANRYAFPKLTLNFSEPVIPIEQVLTDKGLPVVSKTTARLITHILPGDKHLRDVCLRVDGKASRFNNTIAQIGKPSPTILSRSKMHLRPDHTFYSYGDLISVATFPQDYNFLNLNVSFATGMCVPPVLMANIAEEIWQQWLAGLTYATPENS